MRWDWAAGHPKPLSAALATSFAALRHKIPPRYELSVQRMHDVTDRAISDCRAAGIVRPGPLTDEELATFVNQVVVGVLGSRALAMDDSDDGLPADDVGFERLWLFVRQALLVDDEDAGQNADDQTGPP